MRIEINKKYKIKNNQTMIENFIEKPEGKPVKNFKARVKVYGNDVVVVNPQEPKESIRKMIKQKGKSSFYKSEGEKESSYSIHINVDANDPDPVATMQERFAELTKGELKSELKLKVKGKMLYESQRLKVYLNKTTKNVVLQTTIDCSPTIERELLQIQAEMARVIGANYSEILKVFNKKTEEIIDRVCGPIETHIGPVTRLIASDTLQVNDYSRYKWTYFDAEHKKERHEKVFPQDLLQAYEIAQRLFG